MVSNTDTLPSSVSATKKDTKDTKLEACTTTLMEHTKGTT